MKASKCQIQPERLKTYSVWWKTGKVLVCTQHILSVYSAYSACTQRALSTVCRSWGSEPMMEVIKASSLSKTPSLTCSCCLRALIWKTQQSETLPVHHRGVLWSVLTVKVSSHQFLSELQNQVDDFHLRFVFSPADQVLTDRTQGYNMFTGVYSLTGVYSDEVK